MKIRRRAAARNLLRSPDATPKQKRHLVDGVWVVANSACYDRMRIDIGKPVMDVVTGAGLFLRRQPRKYPMIHSSQTWSISNDYYTTLIVAHL